MWRSRGCRRQRNADRIIATLLGAALSLPLALAANPLPRDVQLTSADVEKIVGRAVSEALGRGKKGTIAVVDRVGNVLALYAMTGASNAIKISAGRSVASPSGLLELNDGQPLGDSVGDPLDNGAGLAAIAKAITGAYLSSNGNAFSSRTASMIVQENFFPGSSGLEGGPLFGVQFSQLPCSDLSVRFQSDNGGVIDAQIGPKRSPLGLSADPGGLPVYKSGVLVGGIGVLADGRYGLDRNVRDSDNDTDEAIAVAGTGGFAAPNDLRADRITVDGRSLRFADSSGRKGRSSQPDLATEGGLVAVTGYYAGAAFLDGEAFGFAGSGIQPDPDNRFGSAKAYVLTDAGGANRYPPIGGTDGGDALTANEVTELLRQALQVALSARAQIRRPLDSFVEVTISVVDTNGAILGIVRTPDAPLFGTDVSLQKARSAMSFTNPAALNAIRGLPQNAQGVFPNSYLQQLERFLAGNGPGGTVAFSNRAIGNLARPYYPDGATGKRNGPLSVPIQRWSPFNTGLQLDIVFDQIIEHVGFVLGANADTAPTCALPQLANGLQIFAGGEPIFRGNQLVGGIGVSGDGIDQDDMVGFLGLHRAGERLGGAIGNAPKNIRADRQAPSGANLRYVSCPFKPFVGSDQQSVCQGL